MTVGAISGYTPYISYIAPNQAATPVGKPEEIGQIQGTSKTDKTSPAYECETCENRKYQDGSNEADVSFKSATNVSPEAAASAVRSHEQQHVSNAYQKAEKDNGEVLSATVAIHTSICPECGRTYVSGGTTRTTIKYTNEENPYQKDLKAQHASVLSGANINMIA